MRLLSTLCSVTVKLQHQSLDIISAHEQISDVQNEFELLRINIDEEFYTSFKEVVELLLGKMNTQTGRSSFKELPPFNNVRRKTNQLIWNS